MAWCIYKHTNKINGKVYIGQTCQKPEDRWQGGNGYLHNPYFYAAIQKYGSQTGFTHEIIEENISSQTLANEREIFWIGYYDSYYNGYNLTKGGDNHDHLGRAIFQIDPSSLKIIALFESTREAARVCNGDHALIQRCCSEEEYNDKQCVSAYGYYWCYKEDYNTEWQPKLKKKSHTSGEGVYQIEKYNNEYLIVSSFPSIKNASEELNIPSSNIWQCCKDGSYITAGGFYWCYVKNYSKNWQPRVNKNIARYKKVKRLDDGAVFNSIAEAARCSNIACSETITRVCKGKQKTAGGYHWEYYNEGGDEK